MKNGTTGIEVDNPMTNDRDTDVTNEKDIRVAARTPKNSNQVTS